MSEEAFRTFLAETLGACAKVSRDGAVHFVCMDWRHMDDVSAAGTAVYGKAPVSNRFRKGKSGNPRGRPVGRRNDPPCEAVLGQMVTIRDDGTERRVSAAETFLLNMTKQGLEGDGAAARAAMAAIAEARATRLTRGGYDTLTFVTVYVTSGSVNSAVEPLRMARKLDRYRGTARMALEPWIVEAAIDRLGDKRLSVDEQEIVVSATRTPWTVQWLYWWEIRR